MINIVNKTDCCGCNACAQRCPKQCIIMKADDEGFLYPIVDKETCIECGLCEKVCPVMNQAKPQQPLKVYAAYNKNEDVRIQSSSGGIFTLLAEETIKKGGVVFGVKFNKYWMPEFDYTENVKGIAQFRGSKYVQAIVGNAYKRAEEILKAGRDVLFCGTPCQIAGLKKFLRKEYDNLLTVDIICHGVPSPKVWNMYLKEICCSLYKDLPVEKKQTVLTMGETYKSCIEAISFRSKITGWKKYSFLIKLYFPNSNGKNSVLFTEKYFKNSFMRAFLHDIITRPSCYACPTKQGKSHSDITIADFWGLNRVDPAFDDDRGCGAILINTANGETVYPLVQTIYKEKTIKDVIACNSAYHKSCKPHCNRTKFFKELEETTNLSQFIAKMLKPTLKQKLINKIKRYAKAIMRRIRISK